ncbi:MAG: MerR family transcriptional regulator [Micropruina sp.]|nr:MerR family transcriptional regulator [Micropruina sp.]
MKIGELARLGQVSVRMLRHYDAIGLLTPRDVDPWSGHRSYSPDQLSDLNRIIALKELGFTLEQVGQLMSEPVGVDQLRGMLRLRLAEQAAAVEAARQRLAAVEFRLLMIEKENDMPTDYVIKTLPAVRLAALTATVEPAELSTLIGPMFDRVAARLSECGDLSTPIATYEMHDDGTMDVVVGYAGTSSVPDGLESVELPSATAVCGVHLGEMATIGVSWQTLHRWLAEEGRVPDGPCRELYVKAEGDQAGWVTELQQPVAG